MFYCYITYFLVGKPEFTLMLILNVITISRVLNFDDSESMNRANLSLHVAQYVRSVIRIQGEGSDWTEFDTCEFNLNFS
jgi:hypothetical protein